jgi:putative DNA primase/helicase
MSFTIIDAWDRLDRKGLIKDVRKGPSDGFMACCPVHDDNEPSLHVSLGKGGKVLFYCHSNKGCKYEDIVKALDLWEDSYESTPHRNGVNGSSSAVTFSEPLPKSSTYYVYEDEDEDGSPLFRVRRTPDKKFTQEKWDNGSWISRPGCMKGVPLVPYRLRELLASDVNETVFIVEGEKDVENLRAQGYTATTNVGGAGKWREEYNRFFEGRYVCIIPDNDPAGRDHAQKVGESLEGIAKDVQVLELPGLSEKGDVSDWLSNEDNNPKALSQMAKDAPLFDEWKSAQEKANAPTDATQPPHHHEADRQSDWGNAKRLVELHGGDLHYVAE